MNPSQDSYGAAQRSLELVAPLAVLLRAERLHRRHVDHLGPQRDLARDSMHILGTIGEVPIEEETTFTFKKLPEISEVH